MSAMKALVKDKNAPGAALKMVPIPKPGSKEVLVRVKASSICGTDLHIYNWDSWAAKNVKVPIIFGHEFAGIVEQVGDQVTNVRPGDPVSAEGHFVCGVCKACRTGNAHVCPHTRSLGISVPGAFAEYVLIPAENIIHNSPELPFEVACLQDPLGNAVQTLLTGDVTGKSVAVLGVGPIGLMAIDVARACGAGKIIAIDLNDFRLNMAKQFGADVLVNSSNESIKDAVMRATSGEGVEVLLEMTGHPGAIREGLQSVAHAGRVSLLGIPTREIELDLGADVIFKGIRIEGITGRKMYDTWYQMKGLLDSGKLQLDRLITHTCSLDDYEEAFEWVRSGQCGKVVFVNE